MWLSSKILTVNVKNVRYGDSAELILHTNI